MIALKRILVGIDFSKFSDNALRYACAFARHFSAELHLLHVVPPETLYPEFMVLTDSGRLEHAARERLERLPPAKWVEGRNVVREVCHGHAFVEIIRYARENEIDLIVVGTHGYTGLIHALMGSVAEKVVRKAPCPVLTVHHPEHEFVMPHSPEVIRRRSAEVRDLAVETL